MTDLIIRQAATADLSAIGELWCELMDYHSAFDPHFASADDGRQKFIDHVKTHLDAESSYVLIAEDNGKPVGYCLSYLSAYPPVFKKQNYGMVSDLLVTESCRGRGVGEALYRKAEQWFREKGIDRIELRYAAGNSISPLFWKKRGFTPYLVTAYKQIDGPE